VSVQRVAARAGFIHDVQFPTARHNLPQCAIHIAQATANGAVVPYFTPHSSFRQRYVNRILVNIHADINSGRLLHGLPPHS
jgi:hypothetical protein